MLKSLIFYFDLLRQEGRNLFSVNVKLEKIQTMARKHTHSNQIQKVVGLVTNELILIQYFVIFKKSILAFFCIYMDWQKKTLQTRKGSQFGERKDEWNRPTPVRRRLSLTQAARGKPIPTGLAPIPGTKARSLEAFSMSLF